MSKVNKNSGFTLIEFIVYIAIFAFVILFLMQFLTGMLLSSVRARAHEAIIINATQAINAIDFEIRHAEALYEPTSDFSSNMGQLSLVTQNDVPAQEEETYVDVYISDDERVCIKKETGIICVTSDEVEIISLNFNKIQPTVGQAGVQTILTLEYKTNNEENRVQFTLQSSSSLRAYE